MHHSLFPMQAQTQGGHNAAAREAGKARPAPAPAPRPASTPQQAVAGAAKLADPARMPAGNPGAADGAHPQKVFGSLGRQAQRGSNLGRPLPQRLPRLVHMMESNLDLRGRGGQACSAGDMMSGRMQ